MIRKSRRKHVFIKQPFHRGAICYLRDINSKLPIYCYFYFSWIWILSSSYFLLTTYLIYEFHSAIYPLKSRWTLQWRHNGCGSVSNHQPHDCLLNRIFRRRSKKMSRLRVTGLCAENSPRTGEFPAQRASNAEMFPFDDVIMASNKWISSPILA